jgi:diacylglycerol kinase (ATP)
MINKLKFCIVVNINAHRNRKLLYQIIDLLKNDHDVEVFVSKSKKIAKEIFKNLSSKIFDRLVIAGGDGSFNFAINEILQHSSLLKKDIGYIPMGTANILQIEAKIQINAEAIAEVLIAGNIKKISLFKINDQFFFLMAGIGFDGKIVASIDTRIKKYLGKIIFALKGFQHFLFLNSKKIEVLFDNEKIEADWILSTNSKYYAGPYKITKITNIFQNDLVTYIFKDLTRLKILYYLFLILIYGDLSKAKSIIVTRSKHIKINKLHSDLMTQIDGELFDSKENIEIVQSSQVINLLINKNTFLLQK